MERECYVRAKNKDAALEAGECNWTKDVQHSWTASTTDLRPTSPYWAEVEEIASLPEQLLWVWYHNDGNLEPFRHQYVYKNYFI